jgi:formylglycine-generating enzyme required for sulfatase activity
MRHHRWFTLLTLAFAVALPGLQEPLLCQTPDRKREGKEDALIAAMKFVKVPQGTFWMSGESGKPPARQVEIKEDFELAAYLVTQEQWQAVMGGNPSHFSRQGDGKNAVKNIADADLKRFPAEMVSWNDAQAFLKKVNEREQGRGWFYRLPTEAEWEYACRGGATSKKDCSFDFYFEKPTNDLSSLQANFYGDFPAGEAAKGPTLGRTAKVGSYAPNKLGLYDMHGNLWQWCENPNAKEGARAVRGGSWCVTGKGCRAAHRAPGAAPTLRYCDTGLRLARVPQPPQWSYSLELKCRTSKQAKFDMARAFGVEVYDYRGKALYITETGMLAAGDFQQARPKPPTWLHRLALKVRPPGFEAFPLTAFGLEVYRDEHNGHWLYISENGPFAVLPGARSFKAPKQAKAAAWLHGLDLKVRTATQARFDRFTRVWSLEVYRDDNNANLVYIGEGGRLAVVPGVKGAPAPTPQGGRAPMWLNGFNLKVRKAGPPPAKFETFGVEVYRDENNGNLLYVADTGHFAVVPGKGQLQAPLRLPQTPILLHQFDLKCRKAGETEFGGMAFGVAAFADRSTACTLYISEKGTIAAVANP